MAIGDGARGVPKNAEVTVRDIRALRVKLTNHVRLSQHIGGYTDQVLAELDSLPVAEGDDGKDKRSLLTRTLEILHDIAASPKMRSSVKSRAAKAIAETIVELSKDRTKARIAASTLAQQSHEHADKVKLKERELDIAEGMNAAVGPTPLSGLSTGALERMLTHAADPPSAPAADAAADS